jgi:hypothetical protein
MHGISIATNMNIVLGLIVFLTLISILIPLNE